MSTKNDQPLHFRARIREVRRQQKITQEEMAEHLGISAAWYARKERGETDIDIDRELPLILACLGITWEEVSPPPRKPCG